MKIGIIVVNFNNAGHTEKMVASVASIAGGHDVDFVIVDNASQITDFNYLKRLESSVIKIRIISSKTNLGYFNGLNLGLKSLTGSYDYVMVANNDLILESDFFRQLQVMSFHDDVAVIAPNIITLDGVQQNPLCVQRMSKIRKAGLKIYYINYYFGNFIYSIRKIYNKLTRKAVHNCPSQYIYMGIGAAYILTPLFFDKMKVLPTDVFLWSEEALLGGRLAAEKLKMWYESKIILHHAENSSTSKMPSRKVYFIAKESFHKTYKYY
ncbi:MAG: hypothetical protein RIQ89_2310 [Bacteroidota bacterium]|jgi:GT2 family glycosyltransferase